MDTKIKHLLDKNKVKYEILEHRKVYTAFNAAETQHVDTKQVVKTVYVKFSGKIPLLSKERLELAPDSIRGEVIDSALICVPAGKRVDLKKIAKVINDNQEKTYRTLVKADPKAKKPAKVIAKLASEKDIANKLKTKVGLIAPFGEIFSLPILMDKKLAGNKKLVVSAGSYTVSVELFVKDYLKLVKPIMGNFTE